MWNEVDQRRFFFQRWARETENLVETILVHELADMFLTLL